MDNGTVGAGMKSAIAKAEGQTPYLRMALTSGHNVVLMLLCLLAGLASGEWWLLAIGLGLEGAWLALAPRLPLLRHGFDQAYRDELRQRADAAAEDGLRLIGEADRQRYHDLDGVRMAIRERCACDPGVSLAIGEGEMDHLDRLLRSFLQIAMVAARYERYIERSDLSVLEADVERQRRIVERLAGGPEKEAHGLAERNLELLERRLEKALEMRRKLRVTRAQLNLVENTVRLLRDQVATMETPDALTEQLGELMSSIDILDLSGREADDFYRRLSERSPSAPGDPPDALPGR